MQSERRRTRENPIGPGRFVPGQSPRLTGTQECARIGGDEDVEVLRARVSQLQTMLHRSRERFTSERLRLQTTCEALERERASLLDRLSVASDKKILSKAAFMNSSRRAIQAVEIENARLRSALADAHFRLERLQSSAGAAADSAGGAGASQSFDWEDDEEFVAAVGDAHPAAAGRGAAAAPSDPPASSFAASVSWVPCNRLVGPKGRCWVYFFFCGGVEEKEREGVGGC